MSLELLDAILQSQNAIKPTDFMGDYNRGTALTANNLKNNEQSQILSSREDTNKMIANGDLTGAINNAYANGDTEMAANIQNRINQGRALVGGVANRLVQMPQEQRQAALQSYTPYLQQQGIDPSSIGLDDNSLTALSTLPETTQEQQAYGINNENARSNLIRANADYRRQDLEAQYKPIELGIRQQQADAATSNAQNQINSLNEKIFENRHPILSEGQTSPYVESDGDNSSPYNQVYSGSSVTPSQPLSTMTTAQREALGNQQIADTAGKIGQGNLGTSAMGFGGMTNPTYRAQLQKSFPDLMPDEVDNAISSPEVQVRVAHDLTNSIIAGNKNPAQKLKATFQSLQGIPDKYLNTLDTNGILKLISVGENGHQLTDQEIANGNAITKPTIKQDIPSQSNQPATFRGLPIIHNQDEEDDFALNGGGAAYRPGPTPGTYYRTNIKANKPSGDQLDAATKYNSVNKSLNVIHELLGQGYNPTSVLRLGADAARLDPSLFEKSQRFNNALQNVIEAYSRGQSGAAISEPEMARFRNEITPEIRDTPTTSAQKMLYLENYARSLRNQALGKVRVDPEAGSNPDGQGMDGIMNEVSTAVRNKDTNAIRQLTNRFGRAFVTQAIQSAPVMTSTDFDALNNARRSNDTTTYNQLVNKYGRDVITKALKSNNRN